MQDVITTSSSTSTSSSAGQPTTWNKFKAVLSSAQSSSVAPRALYQTGGMEYSIRGTTTTTTSSSSSSTVIASSVVIDLVESDDESERLGRYTSRHVLNR